MATTTADILDPEAQRELEELARAKGRDANELASEAVRGYVRYERMVHEAVQQGISDVNEGRTLAHADVMRMLEDQRSRRISK